MGSASRTVELEEEPSRDNGWSCPPHPLQVVAWITVIVLAIIHNTSLVPALPTSWQPAGYIVSLKLNGSLITVLIVHRIVLFGPGSLLPRWRTEKQARGRCQLFIIYKCYSELFTSINQTCERNIDFFN